MTLSVRISIILVSLLVWIGWAVSLGPVSLQAWQVMAILMTGLAFSVISANGRVPLRGLTYSERSWLLLIVLAIGLVIASIALSAFANGQILASFQWSVRFFLGIFLILFFLVFSRKLEGACGVLSSLALAGAASSILVVIFDATFGSDHLLRGAGQRAQAFLNNPNQFAMLLLAATPGAALLGNYSQAPWFWRVVLIFLLIGLALSGSKMNIALSLVITSTVWVLARRERLHIPTFVRVVRVLGTFAVIGCAAFFILTWLAPRALSELIQIAEDAEAISAYTVRIDQWLVGLELIRANMVFGIGPEATYNHIRHGHFHNAIIHYAVVGGVLAGIGVLLIYIACLWRFWVEFRKASVNWIHRRPDLNQLTQLAAMAGASGYLLANLTSDSLGGTTIPVLWLLLGVYVVKSRSPVSQQC